MRILGTILIAIGLGFLAGDVWVYLQSGDSFSVRSLGAWWADIHLNSLLLLQPAVERHLTPALWDPGIQTLLEWPAAIQFLVLGGIIRFLGRKRVKVERESKAKSLDFGKK